MCTSFDKCTFLLDVLFLDLYNLVRRLRRKSTGREVLMVLALKQPTGEEQKEEIQYFFAITRPPAPRSVSQRAHYF